MTCAKCADKGLIRVAYQSGEPFDLALCSCRFGRFFRDIPDRILRTWLAGPNQPPLPEAHQIGLMEDFEDGAAVAPPIEPPDYTRATKQVMKRAKL